ncbi:MAG: sigma-54-dependent Fis family transcriptional regulator, partial [Acidobacteriota bacterium]
RFERAWMTRQLAETDGSLTRTAARLGISETELRRRLERLGIDAPGQAPG